MLNSDLLSSNGLKPHSYEDSFWKSSALELTTKDNKRIILDNNKLARRKTNKLK